MAEVRENNINDAEYGSLNLRSYNISGNDIDAFYDADDDLVFVLDKTINAAKPNVLLVINPDADKKWDEILSGDYGVDLEYVRPKQDNKYQKLDIEYSGLSVYGNLINAYVAGDDIEDGLVQLNVLRNSAARHSAMMRLNAANEIITRTNVTIVKTKESIVRLETRLKNLRVKLADMKKEIGRVAPKQSAAKILRLESQIDTTKEKIKRAHKRLESAEKRLETATVDAKLASDLLNQPNAEIKQITKNKPVMVAPKHEIQTVVPDDESDSDDDDFDEEPDEQEVENMTDDIKPLFDKDPEIVNEDIAFKPVKFDAPELPVPSPAPAVPKTLEVPGSDNEQDDEEITESVEEVMKEPEQSQPVLESLTPIVDEPIVAEPVFDESDDTEKLYQEEVKEEVIDEQPVEQIVETPEKVDPIDVQPVPASDADRPMSPVVEENKSVAPLAVSDYGDKKTKSSFLYYALLLILILLSVFALWMYQKNMGSLKPLLSIGKNNETVIEPAKRPIDVDKPVVTQPVVSEDVFVDEPNTISEPQPEMPGVGGSGMYEEPVIEDSEPIIIGGVSEKISAFANMPENKPEYVEPVQEVIVDETIVNKPAYGAGEKYDEMFVYEEDVALDEPEYDEEYSEPVIYQPEQNQVIYYQEPDQTTGINEEDYDGFVDQYNPDVFYDNYDPEEAAYQAGDDGYEEYR